MARQKTHGSEARQDTPMSRKMKKKVQEAAHAQGMNSSEWVRRQLSMGIRRVLKEVVEE